VRDIRSVASAINNGTDVEAALRNHDIEPGGLSMGLPPELYIELRHRASMENREPGAVVADALAEYFATE